MKKFHTRIELARIFLAVLAENLFETRHLRQIHANRSRIQGAFPPPGETGIVLCACDERYYARFAADFVLSAEATGQRHAVHLHLYAPSAETLDHVDRMRRTLTRTSLSYTWEGHEFEGYGVEGPVYYTTGRYLLMYHLLATSQAPVLCVDIDGLIRQPLHPAFEQIRSADLTIHFRLHRSKAWRRVLAAAIGINSTPATLRFCERMASSIEAVLHQKPDYHIDQTILYYMYRIGRRLRRDVRWQHLPLGWVDYNFSDDSLIWTAKAARKQDERFRNAIAALEVQYGDLYRSLPTLDPVGS